MRVFGWRKQDGYTTFNLAFDKDEFAKHIRAQGRKLVIRQRLEITAGVVTAIGVILCLAYAGLKMLGSRDQTRRDDDYLTNTNVSMV